MSACVAHLAAAEFVDLRANLAVVHFDEEIHDAVAIDEYAVLDVRVHKLELQRFGELGRRQDLASASRPARICWRQRVLTARSPLEIWRKPR